jgi:hypothetical protein
MTFKEIFGRELFSFTRKKKDSPPYVPFNVIKSDIGNYDLFYKKVIRGSLIILIVGKRGSGKTSLGMKFLEIFHSVTKRKCYALGFEKTKLPFWIKKAVDVDGIPNNSIALFDEGAIMFSARESMKNINKELSKVMAIARHKNLTLILITQNSAMIELNVLRLADTLLLKEPSLLQSRFERKSLVDIFVKVKPEFEKLKDKNSHVYVWDDEFQGMLRYDLPEFWTEKISTSFRNYK